MLGFQIHHFKKDGTTPEPVGAISARALLFETCLRKIWIAPGESSAPDRATLQGADAYRFLLEVIAGLCSPIFGETEILGQFRQFLELQRENPDFAFFQPWARLLMEDVRLLRSTYFRGQGQHSYGSLLRKKLSGGEKIWILGAGQLTESLLPWLNEQAVTLWARDAAKVADRFPGYRVVGTQDSLPADAILMVAAPLSEKDLAALLPPGQCWIDLREKNISSTLPKPKISLMDLYRESAAGQEQKSELKTAVLSRIQALSEERMNRAWFRPQGWEDTCAS